MTSEYVPGDRVTFTSERPSGSTHPPLVRHGVFVTDAVGYCCPPDYIGVRYDGETETSHVPADLITREQA